MEDIHIIDSRAAKYLELNKNISEVIGTNATEIDTFLEDIVDAFFKLSGSTIWLYIITIGVVLIKNGLKRKKLRKVIEVILRKIFDIYLDWYVMDYEDIKETCDYIAGKGYFSREDHRHIYIAVIHKLKEGPIRDRCIELGIINFVNEKLIDIRDNYLEFKAVEL